MPATSPYTNPELAGYLDCYEYLPMHDETPRKQPRSGWSQRLLEKAAPLLPGLALAGVMTAAGYMFANLIDWSLRSIGISAVSPILLAIILGLVLANTARIPTAYESGLRWCARHVLRIGIVLLGLRLSLSTMGAIGWGALPLVVTCITAGLLIVIVAGRVLGLSPRLATLIGVGTGVCGISAIVATAPAIGAEDDEVSYAAGCITLFGLIALLTYPWLTHAVFAGDPNQTGLFLGTAVHDTSQVTGAALLYSQWYDAPRALEVATVTKLLRNLFIVAVVPLMSLLHHQRGGAAVSRWWQAVPGFVLLFVAMVALRSTGDLGARAFGVLPRDSWSALLNWCQQASVICLTAAMAAVGIGTRLAKLRRLGARPLILGLVAASAVGGISFLLIRSGMIHT